LTFQVTTNNDALFSSLPKIDSLSGKLTYALKANATGKATVSVRLIDDGSNVAPSQNTSALKTFVIDISPLAVSVSSKTNVVINGASTGSITVSGSGGTSPYEYRIGTGAYQSGTTFNSLAAGTYTITIKDANGVTKTNTATITQPAATLAVAVSSQINVIVYGASTGSITVAASGGTSPYQYKVGTGSYQSDPTFNALPAGTYTITIKDANGITTTTTATITQPEVKEADVPNMFSPNGDGINDLWEIENIQSYPPHTLTIFDRAGRILYNVHNYNNEWAASVNGKQLEEGTYYYIIRFDDSINPVKKGFITIVR
jgi:gliding motility-associated-like protein